MHSLLIRFLLVSGLIILLSTPAVGCVGRILYVGAQNSTEDKVMAELLVLLINERTGTNVQIRYFDTQDQIYTALKSDDEETRVDIIVEDTDDAASILGQERMTNLDREYLDVKDKYDAQLSIIWLNPFGFSNNKSVEKPSVSAPLVRRDVLTNFPLLPRILNKLSGAINDETFTSLTARVESGDKAKKVAKDFLRARKFI